MKENIVYVVHCIDTEGPLFESLEATSQRLNDIFSLDISLTPSILFQLQNEEVELGGIEKEVAKVLSPDLLNYLDNWDKIDEMLSNIMSSEFRISFPDSFEGGWKYNWHCLDHVGFIENPRRRDTGIHSVFDHYMKIVKNDELNQDSIQFHHHPIGFSRAAHLPATNYLSHDPKIFEILARKIIDRKWFPSVYRPGFHTTRPDSHWFLEQYIPFEYASQSKESNNSEQLQKDLSDGRFGDWRRAPVHWQPYHPDHDDYQIEGNCRRYITRCLNIGTRVRLLEQEDVDQAFQEAKEGKPVILAFTNHDFRNIEGDINHVRSMLMNSASRYGNVKFKYASSLQAFRESLKLDKKEALKFETKMNGNVLHIKVNHRTFGPQPFLAIKTKTGQYYHDNLDFQTPFLEWSYTFDSMTIPMSSIEVIGLASCDDYGNVAVHTIEF